MSENKVIKSVSFNKLNEDDKKMLKHFSKRNFSGYVKKLIMQDILKKEEEKGIKAKDNSEKPKEKPVSASDELQQMKQQKREQQAPPTPNLFIKKQ